MTSRRPSSYLFQEECSFTELSAIIRFASAEVFLNRGIDFFRQMRLDFLQIIVAIQEHLDIGAQDGARGNAVVAIEMAAFHRRGIGLLDWIAREIVICDRRALDCGEEADVLAVGTCTSVLRR